MHEISHIARRTQSELVAEAVRDIIADLRLIDADDLIGYIKARQWANINDLVQSSAELFLEDGTLSFACAGEFEMDWSSTPKVSLDMEFQRDDITVFFTIRLGGVDDAVVIRDVWFASRPADEAECTAALAAALATARRKAAAALPPQ